MIDGQPDAARLEDQPMSGQTSTGQRVSPWASGLILFAGGMLVITGVLQIFVGTAAPTVSAGGHGSWPGHPACRLKGPGNDRHDARG
jgi:hypothetical protein